MKKMRRNKSSKGFTMIELLIVITIILILIGIAAVHYDHTVMSAREAVLRADLQTMRESIDNYTLDKQAAPQSLEDLHNGGYLRNVPIDPMTHSADWQPQFDNVVLGPDQTSTGMTDVHSNSDKVSPFDGSKYSEW
jgi:general secretion pathway protein G